MPADPPLNPTPPSPQISRAALFGLLLAFAIVWFSTLDYRRLIHPDEGRYAEIPREMAASGDWVTPRLDGIKYFEKPPLQYWLTAATYQVLGTHQWTARLWPALYGFVGVLFIAYVGMCLGGARVGLYSGAVLGGVVWYVFNTHILTLDAGLTFWMSVGMGGLLLAQRAETTLAAQRAWMLCAWAALALAVLSKGPVGVVLPGGALVVYSLLTRDWAVWRRLHLLPGALLFLAIAAPWFVIVSMRNKEFAQFFFIHEHFDRFLTDEHHRVGAWWYFVPLLAAGILPWLTVFVWTARKTWSDPPPAVNGFAWQRYLLVWSGFIFVFFSASGSKLPSYILPMFPALALTIGWQLTSLSDRALTWLTIPLVAATVVFALVSAVAPEILIGHFGDGHPADASLLAYARWISAALALASVGGMAALVFLRGHRRTAAVLSVAGATLFASLVALNGHDELAESRSAQPILARVTVDHGALRNDVPFYAIRMYDQTLPYYLGRTVTPVEYEDELAMGIASEPGKAISNVAAWILRWQAVDQAYAIMQPETFETLRSGGLSMRELGRDSRRVIVARR